MTKIVIIGANHAGTAAANTILDNYPEAQLTLFDRNSNISYLGCGTALWVGRQIDDPESLFYCSAEKFRARNAKVHMETEVTQIDFEQKTVHAVDKEGKEIAEPYDKLILATGSLPILPRIEGLNLPNVQSVKLYQDGMRIDRALESEHIGTVAVVGAGYIGVEIAEAIQRRGRHALLFDVAEGCLTSYYDDWFSHDMDHVLEKNGVELHFNETVTAVKGVEAVSAISTDKGEYAVDMVVLCIGFVPNSILGREKLATIPNGAYLVDRRQRASMQDVYAIGDCAAVYNNALQGCNYVALATNAVRSGIIAAHNACGTHMESSGVQGSNGIHIFGYNMVSTGFSLAAAKRAGFDAAYTQYEDLQKPPFVKAENAPVKLRIVYDKNTRRVLGAQMASTYDISMGIHMFSLAIEEGVTIDKLKLLDIFFLPHFNQPYNYITLAALAAK